MLTDQVANKLPQTIRVDLNPGILPFRIRHVNQIELSRRWNISPRTLERWRWLKQGPVYLKLGGRVAYRIEDVEAFEAAQSRCSATVGGPLVGGA